MQCKIICQENVILFYNIILTEKARGTFIYRHYTGWKKNGKTSRAGKIFLSA